MKKWLNYLVLLVSTVVFIYPFLWMISATLKPEKEIANLSLWPQHFTLQNYIAVFEKIPIVRAFGNSLIVAVSVVISVLIFCSWVGYALSRLRFRGRDALSNLIIFTMVLPFQLTLIPMYLLIVKLGWADTYLAVIAPYMMSSFAIILFRQFFKSIPQDLIDAARIDGCSEFRIIFQIFWPLSVPALITVGIIVFMGIWNEVLWPLMVIHKQKLMVMPQLVALFTIGGASENRLGVQLAAATLLALPILLAYLFFQRYFIESMATTGLKE